MKNKFKANKMELQKIPHNGRLVWVIVDEMADIYVCRTYQTFNKLRGKTLGSIYVLHTARQKVKLISRPTDEQVNQILDNWRDNYFNSNWFPLEDDDE